MCVFNFEIRIFYILLYIIYHMCVQIVIDGHVITSQGPGDSITFALSLVEVLFGKEKAQVIGKEMLAFK